MSSERKWRRGDRLKVTRGPYAQKMGSFVYGVEDEKGEGSFVVQLDGMGIAIVSSREFIYLPSSFNNASPATSNSSKTSSTQVTPSYSSVSAQDHGRKRNLETSPENPEGPSSSAPSDPLPQVSQTSDAKKAKLAEEGNDGTAPEEIESQTGSGTFKNAHTNAPHNNATTPYE